MKRLLPFTLLLSLCCGKSKPPPSIADFHLSATSIEAGGSTWLYLSVTGADSLRIDPDPGDATGKAAVAVGPLATTTYTLTATNSGGSASATATLTVIPRPATLTSFAAAQDSIVAGQPVTLQWTASGADAIVLSASPPPAAPLPALQPRSGRVVLSPAESTVYTLTVSGAPGTVQPAPLSTTVMVAQAPAVALSSAASTVARGSATSLRWTSPIPATFTLVTTPHGAASIRTGLGTLTTTSVRPLADSDYAIEALGPGGSRTSNTVTVAVSGTLASSLAYVAPTPSAGDVAALQLRSISADGLVATLELVALQQITAGALALELPLDGAAAGSRDGSARVLLDAAAAGDVSPGFTVNAAALDPGSAPAAAIAALPASGPAAGVLLLALAQKPLCATLSCTGGVGADRALPAGSIIAALRLRLVPEGGQGPVFAAGSLDAARGFRSVVRSGTSGKSLGSIAVGSLSAN